MTITEARKQLLDPANKEKRDKAGWVECPRCGGSGTYSYCTMYGNTCFKCNGLGFIRNRKKTG